MCSYSAVVANEVRKDAYVQTTPNLVTAKPHSKKATFYLVRKEKLFRD
jgi:hypothetical protein